MASQRDAVPTKEGDNELKNILSNRQRDAFSLLIVTITEEMKRSLLCVFDASFTNYRSNPNDPRNATSNPNLPSSDERQQPNTDREEEKKLREEREEREREISAPEMQKLKRDACLHFDDWQKAVTMRVGEVLETEAGQQQAEAKRAAEAESAARRPEYKVVGMSDVFKSREKVPQAHNDEKEQHNEEKPDEALARLYPPTSTELLELGKDKRTLVLNSTLLLLLSLEHYDVLSRQLLLHMCSSLHLPLATLTETETKVAATLLQAAKQMSGSNEAKQRGEANATSRKWKVGLAGIAGAALIGITGGLAAPLVAAGIGTIMGGLGLGATAAAGLLGALAQSGVLVGALFGAYGGKMTGEMMDAYAREVEDFRFLPLHGRTVVDNKTGRKKAIEGGPADRRLRVSIGISGWLTQKEDVVSPWRSLGTDTEVFALRYELDALMNLGVSMEFVIKSYAWGVAKKEIIKRTIFGSLMMALWPLSFLKASKVLDNPFSIAMGRSDKAGKVLADAIINKAQGERPVTLVGYSLGARVIYSCLTELADRGAYGLVENAVLIGTPCPSETGFWRRMKSVVSGRLINVYSENDYVLGFLYRTSSIQLGIAGLQEIEVAGVENVDVSELVSGHLRYQYLVGSILRQIGWQDLDEREIRKEEEMIRLMDREDEEREEEQKREAGALHEPAVAET